MSANSAQEMVIDFVAGVNGGIATVYTGQPLDTVKVKMQTFPEQYRGAVSCFVSTLRRDGIRGLYAGTFPALAANIAENSILFAAYGQCQKLVAGIVGCPTVSELHPVCNATAGFLAAFFSSLALCPTELVKCRLQAQRETQQLSGEQKFVSVGPWGMTKRILGESGFRGLFRGLGPTFGREMPGYFFFFGGYETARYLLTPEGSSKDELSTLKTALAGGIGGVSLWVAIFPFDVVKSRMQVSSSKIGSGPGTFQFMRQIAQVEGVRALYNGLGPSVVRSFPATGALFVAVEWTRKSLHQLTD